MKSGMQTQFACFLREDTSRVHAQKVRLRKSRICTGIPVLLHAGSPRAHALTPNLSLPVHARYGIHSLFSTHFLHMPMSRSHFSAHFLHLGISFSSLYGNALLQGFPESFKNPLRASTCLMQTCLTLPSPRPLNFPRPAGVMQAAAGFLHAAAGLLQRPGLVFGRVLFIS